MVRVKSVMLGHHVKATILTSPFFLHQPKHAACAVNHSNKHILLHITWKSYTLRVVSIPSRAYCRDRALRGWARSRACRRLLGRRQRQTHCLHTSHTAALPAPPPRRPVSPIKTQRAMIELHKCSSPSKPTVEYGSKAVMARVKTSLALFTQ